MDGERSTEVPDVRRCECCGKPYDRDDDCVAVDSRDLLNWLAALWWRDPRLSGLVFSRLMLPRAPLQQLAPMIGASKATTTRLWKRLESAAPAVAAWLRGAERRGGKRNEAKRPVPPREAWRNPSRLGTTASDKLKNEENHNAEG